MIKSDSHSDFPTENGRIRRVSTKRCIGALVGVLALVAVGCGDDSSDSTGGEADQPTIVVTTSILGDVVSNLIGDSATVEVIMPPGSDPHEFQASAQEANQMREADVLVVNGVDFEEGLHDTLEAAESDGVTVCVAIDGVETIEFGGEHGHADEHADDEHADDEHADDEHADEHADDEHSDDEDHADKHDHEGVDPHFFTDPARMAVSAENLTDCIVDAVPNLDTDEVRSTSDAYVAQLVELDEEVEATLAGVPDERRVLITNHEVFGYFADRYGFEVAGAVIPGGSTQGEASAQQIAELAALVEAEGVPAIFADSSSPDQLAEALASEANDVAIVSLFSESLGPDGGATYVAMIRTNAQRIADALS